MSIFKLKKKAERNYFIDMFFLAMSSVLGLIIIGSIFYMSTLYFTMFLTTNKTSLNGIQMILLNGCMLAIYAVLVYPLLQSFIRYNKK
jgi:uncharacterized protein YacL